GETCRSAANAGAASTASSNANSSRAKSEAVSDPDCVDRLDRRDGTHGIAGKSEPLLPRCAGNRLGSAKTRTILCCVRMFVGGGQLIAGDRDSLPANAQSI